MEFVSPIIDLLCEVSKPLARHAKYILKAQAHIGKMETDLKGLRARRDDLQKVKAMMRREQITGQLVLWENNVNRIEEQADATKDSYRNRGCLFFGDCSFNCCLMYRHGKKAAKLHKKMVELIGEWEPFRVATMMRPPEENTLAMPIESTLLGLDLYVERVWHHLSDDAVGVIGLHGMGGVGKTTLLKKVHNSLLEGDKMGFAHLIWVVVSKEFQPEKLQAQVAESLRLTLSNEANLPRRASLILNFLKDKSFLLFLDDVWEWVDLLKVGIPDTRCSSKDIKRKVILTTRSREVCGSMGAINTIIRVEPLDEDTSMILFKKTLDNNYLECDPQIHNLMEDVVKECRGLPLALTVIARAMSSKTSILEWRTALTYLRRSQVNEIIDDNQDMLHRLKLSYDNLKSDALRRSFLYCSLWPEDHDISDHQLIEFFIGNELIKDLDSSGETHDKGLCLIEDLKRVCLLEVGDGDNCIKMHDVMRDLALWIASDCGSNQNVWLVKPGTELLEAPSRSTQWEQAQVVSLMHNRIEQLSFLPCECPISILLLNSNPLSKVHPRFFQNMNALTHLDLSHTRISELPESITTLRRLKYLNLENTNELESIPPRMISGFKELQVLNLFKSGACKILDFQQECEEVVDDIVSVKDSLVEELERLPRGLLGLAVNVYTAKSFGGLSTLSCVSVWRLGLEGLRSLVALQLKPNIWRDLRWLYLDLCGDVEVMEFGCDGKIESEATCPVLQLKLRWLIRLKEILWRPGVAPSVFFARLRFLKIECCHQLKSISWVLCLPSLIELTLEACDGLECLLLEEDGQGRPALPSPCLKELELFDLPNLSSISSSSGPLRSIHLPALETLFVWKCPKLKKFPLLLSSNKLQKLWCDD